MKKHLSDNVKTKISNHSLKCVDCTSKNGNLQIKQQSSMKKLVLLFLLSTSPLVLANSILATNLANQKYE